MMKNLLLYLILLSLFSFSFLTGCTTEDPGPGEPDRDPPAKPSISISVSEAGNQFLPGTELVFTVSASAEEGMLFLLTVSPSVEGEGGPHFGDYVYEGSETVEYIYKVPFYSGNITVNFSVVAAHKDDLDLQSEAATDNFQFSVSSAFTEIKNVKLFNMYGSNNAKSMLRWDTGETYSYKESYDGNGDLKLGIDIFSWVKVEDVNGTPTTIATLASTGSALPGEIPLMQLWGNGSWIPHRRHTSTPEGFTKYNLLDYEAFNPEDIFTTLSEEIQVEVGDVITFDNAAIGGYNPDGDVLVRSNPDIIGAMKIEEISAGSSGTGSDGYIVFSYKFAEK